MTLLWREQMSVGNLLLDADHRYLICLINTVELALRSEEDRDILETTLQQLQDYATEHFAREERLQLAIHYARHDAHKASHAELQTELGKIRLKIAVLHDTGTTQAAAPEVIDFLRHWLIDHVFREDMLMKPYLTQYPKEFVPADH